MDIETKQKILEIENKINEIYKDVKQAKRVFIITLVINIVVFVLPLIGLVFAVPMLMNSLNSLYSGF